jgi:hypothetical protein
MRKLNGNDVGKVRTLQCNYNSNKITGRIETMNDRCFWINYGPQHPDYPDQPDSECRAMIGWNLEKGK